MKTLMRSLLIVVTFAGLSQASFAGGLPATDRAALLAQARPDLAAQRAGANGTAVPMAQDERAALAAAAAQAPDLAAQRGGDVTLSDHDLGVAGVAALIVIALIIIF